MTALAIGVLVGSWLLFRTPDRIETTVGTDASSAPSAVESRSRMLVVDPGAGPSAARESDRKLAVEKAEIESSAESMVGGGRRALVHVHGVVSGIPRRAVKFTADPDSRDARAGMERRVARLLGNQAAGSSDTSDSSRIYTVASVQSVGTLLARDKDDRTEEALIDVDGKYSLPELHTGKWELAVDVPSCQPVRTDIELGADETERRIDFRLEPKKRIQVHLIAHPATRATTPTTQALPDSIVDPNSWRTVAQVSVVATREAPGAILEAKDLGKTQPFDVYLLVSGPDGSAENAPSGARGDQTRTLFIADPLPLHINVVVHGVVLETKLADVDTEELSFEIEGDRLLESTASARLRVVDAESGEVPADCTVTLEAQPTWNGYHHSRGSSSGAPDPRGDIELQGISTGPITLEIRAEGYEAIVQKVQVTPGDNDFGTFKLDRWCVILGRTLDVEKHPVSVIVNVFPLDQFESTRIELSKRCFKSNDDGELRIPSIGRGRYLVRVRDEKWGAPPLVVDTAGGTVRGVEIVLKPKVDVALRFEHTLRTGALIRLSDGGGLPVLESECTPGRLQRIRAVPGLYTLRVTRGNEDVVQSALFVDTKPSEVVIPGAK
jgi:hypothetical protein